MTGVQTNRGPIKAGTVLNCTAGWSSLISGMAGVRLPITTHILQACVTEPLKPFLDVVIVSSQMHVYISQTDRGEVLMGAEIEPWTTYRMQGTLNFLQEVTRHTLELFPQLERARMLRSWAGLCDLSPDYSPILGKTEVEGFHISAGWGTYGFKAAPIVGKTLAELVATDRTPDLIAPFALERFYEDKLVIGARGSGGEPLIIRVEFTAEERDEEQPGDRAGGGAQADRGDRRAGRAAAGRGRPVRALQGEDLAGRARPAQGRARRQARLRGRRDADQGGGGQDHHRRVAHPGPRPHRQGPAAVPARAVARAGVRHQGRRRRRRHGPGRADGGPQPPLHRRHPRRSAPPTTCSPRCSTPRSCTATRTRSTRCGSAGSARST